jgi:hypothetical protein
MTGSTRDFGQAFGSDHYQRDNADNNQLDKSDVKHGSGRSLMSMLKPLPVPVSPRKPIQGQASCREYSHFLARIRKAM